MAFLRSLRTVSVLLGVALLTLTGLQLSQSVPTADAACATTTTAYVDSGTGTDKAGCWGYDSSHAYATISAALTERNASYGGTTIKILFTGDVSQSFENNSTNNVTVKPMGTTTTKAVFTVKGKHYITISGFKFTSSGGVKVAQATANDINVTVENNNFSTATSYVDVTGTNTVNIQNNTFTGFIYDHSNAGRVSIWTNTFTGYANKAGYHVYVNNQSSGGFDFVGNKVTSTGGNVLFMQDSSGAIIMSNTLTGPGLVTATAVQLVRTGGNIQNNTITGYGNGVLLQGSSTALNYVDNNKVTLTDTATALSVGFSFSQASVSHFTNNVISGGDYGLKLSQTSVSELSNNSFATISYGIYGETSTALTLVSNNTFQGVSTGLWLVSSWFTTVDSNQFNTTSYGILAETTKGNFTSWSQEGAPSDPPAGLTMRDSTVKNNTFTGCNVGIALAAESVEYVRNNTFTSVNDGVDQYYSTIYVFKNNNLSHNAAKVGQGTGAYLYDAYFTTFQFNNFDGFDAGVKLTQLSNVVSVMESNSYSGGTYGIYLDNSQLQAPVVNSRFISMPYGVYLNTGSSGFTVIFSTFYGNRQAVTLLANLPAGNLIEVANNVFSQFTSYGVAVVDNGDLGTLDTNVYDHAAGGAVLTGSTGVMTLTQAKAAGLEMNGYEESGTTLVNPAGGDFHLNFKSLAVNSADASYGIVKDFDRANRPVCVAPDRGAYEASGMMIFMNSDPDGDGLCNFQETAWGTSNALSDSDADGLSDYVEIYKYFTTPSSADTDGDAYQDGEEVDTYHTDPLDATSHANDFDHDGMDDTWESTYGLDPTVDDSASDLDSDGLTNLEEYTAGTLPNEADSDDDDLEDGDEVSAGTDPLDEDSDDDGMTDGFEVTYGLDALSDDSLDDNDSDGLTNVEEFDAGTSPVDDDTDGDGMDDAWEIDNALDPTRNDAALDTDRDGLSNREEYAAGTDPKDSDTDSDGYNDGVEVDYSTDPLDAASYPSVIDDDGDGIDDAWEALYSCMNDTVDDSASDYDSDGLTNAEEYSYSSNPCDDDTDSDGMDDEWEATYGLDLSSNDAASDADVDGLTNLQEYSLGTDPTDSDTDGDTFTDGVEEVAGTDPLDATDFPPDGDRDGIEDAWEASYICMDATVSDAATDDDSDGLTALEEYVAGTNPCDDDTDGDGMDDAWEVGYGLAATVSSASTDTDSDSLNDLAEYTAGTDPTDSDTDGDTYVDGVEVSAGTDPLDGLDHPTDSDGDGMDDIWEASYTCMDPAVSDATTDDDTDGLTALQEYGYGTDPCTADTDGDTLSDGDEENTYGTDPLVADTDADGYADGAEVTVGSDPLDAASDPTMFADTDGDGLLDTEEATLGTDPADMDSDGDLFRDDYEVLEGSNPLSATSVPDITVTLVGYDEIYGKGTSTSWTYSSASYTTTSSAVVSRGSTYYVGVKHAGVMTLGVQYDTAAYLGTVTVTSCGNTFYLWDPIASSPSCSGTLSVAASSSDLSNWSSLSPYYSFSDWSWFTVPALSFTTYEIYTLSF